MKLAVILSRIPYPLEKGDKLRAFHQIRCLSQSHDIYLFALDADNADHTTAKKMLTPYCKEIHFFSLSPASIAGNVFKAFLKGKPLQVGYFYNKLVHQKVNDLLDAINPDHIYCQLIRTAEYVIDRKTPKSIDYQDVFSMGAKRQIKSSAIHMKPALMIEYKRLKKYENKVFDLFDHKTIISIADRDLIDHPKREDIHIILNGVDFDFFTPTYTKEKVSDLVFTGNMSYAPNVNASEYLVNEVMPLVWKKMPEVSIQLAGATPDKRVSNLASDKVIVTGWLDDIRDAYASSKIFIAPMQIGTGLQNKLLEAMAMEMPAITSPLANDALKASHNQQIMVGTDPQSYADIIVEMMSDINKRDKIAKAGRKFVMENYSWKAASKQLDDILKQ